MRLLAILAALAVSGLGKKVYNTAGGPVANKLNVHIVAHTYVLQSPPLMSLIVLTVCVCVFLPLVLCTQA